MGLTDIAVKSFKPTTKRLEIAGGRGLYLVVQPSGAKSWVYRGRSRGEWVKWKLGDYPTMTRKLAQGEAARARADALAGRVYTAATTEAIPAAPEGRSVSDIWT